MGQIITKEITLQAGDVKIPGFLCLPEKMGPFPIISDMSLGRRCSKSFHIYH
jgi:hypothetical protein